MVKLQVLHRTAFGAHLPFHKLRTNTSSAFAVVLVLARAFFVGHGAFGGGAGVMLPRSFALARTDTTSVYASMMRGIGGVENPTQVSVFILARRDGKRALPDDGIVVRLSGIAGTTASRERGSGSQHGAECASAGGLHGGEEGLGSCRVRRFFTMGAAPSACVGCRSSKSNLFTPGRSGTRIRLGEGATLRPRSSRRGPMLVVCRTYRERERRGLTRRVG